MSRAGALKAKNEALKKQLEENSPVKQNLKINIGKTDQVSPSSSEEDAESILTPTEKTFAARQRYIAKVMDKSSSIAPSPSDITPTKDPSEIISKGDSASEFDTVFSTMSLPSSPGRENKSAFSVASDKHLLASLTSARGSIVSLETANKDLLDALSSRHQDLEKAKLEAAEWQNKFKSQTTELSTLTKENSRLEGALADRDTLIGVRDDELKQARQKIEDLMNQLYEWESKGFDKELKGLQATIASLQSSLADKEAINAAKDKEIADAQEKIDNLTSELEELSTDKQLAEENYVEMSKKDKEDLEKAMHDLAGEHSANELLSEENDDLKKKIEQLKKDLTAATKNSGANSSEMEMLKMKVQSLTRDNDHVHDSLSDINGLLKQRDDEVREARLKIEQLLSELSHLKAQTDHHITTGNSTATELEAAMMKIASLEKELAALALSDDIQGAMQRLQDLNMQLESKIASQTDTLNALLSDHSGLGDEHSVIKGELIHLQETSAAEIKQVTALLDEALHALMQEKCANDLHLEEEAALKSQLAGLQGELHNTKDTLSLKTSELEHFHEHVEELELEISTLREALDDIQIQLNDHGENSTESQRALARNIDQIKKLEDALQNMEVDLAAKEKSLDERNIKVHDLEDEIHGLEDKIAILENDAKLSKTEITDLNSRLNSAVSKANNYENKNKTLRSEIEVKIKREHSLMEQLANLQHLLDSEKPPVSVGDDVTILSLESQLEEAKQELKITLTDLNTVTLECNDYKARYLSCCERLQAVTDEDNTRGETIDDLKFQVQKQKVEADDKISILEKSNAELKEIAEVEKAKTFEFAAFKIKFDSEQQRLSKLEADFSKQGEGVDYLKGQLAMVQTEMERRVNEAAKAVVELTRKLDFEKVANDLLVEKLRAAEEKIRMLENDLVESKNEIAKKFAELEVANKYIEHVDEEIRVVKADLAEKEFLLNETKELLATRDRELTEAQRTIEKLLKRQESLEKELAEAGEKCLASTQAKLNADAEAHGLESTISDLDDELARLKSQNQSLTNNVNSANDTIKALEEKIAKLKAETDELRAENTQLLSDNLGLKRDLTKAEEVKNVALSNYKAAQERIKELEKEVKELKDASKQREMTEASLNAQIMKLQSLLDIANERLKSAEAKSLDLSHEVDSLRGQLNHVNEDSAKKISELEQLVAALHKEYDPLKNSNTELSAENADMKKRIKDLELEVTRLEHAAELKIAELKVCVEDLDKKATEATELKAEIANLKKQLTTRTQEFHESEHQVNVVTLDKEHLADDLSRSEEERVAIAGEMSRANITIKDLQEQLLKLQGELKSSQDQLLKQQAADVSAQYQGALKDIADLQAKLDALMNVEADNKNLQKEIDDLKKQLTQLKDAMSKAQVELNKYEELKVQFAELDKKYHKLEGVHSACPSQLTVDELRTKLGDTERVLMEANEKIKKLQGENDQLHKDLSHDGSDMSKLKAEVKKLQQLLEVANKELKDMHASYDKQAQELFDKNIELNEKEHMVNDLKKIIDDISSELTKLQHDLRDSEEIVKARDLEIEDLKRQLALALANKPSDQSAEIAKYQAEMDALRKQLEESDRKKEKKSVTVVETPKPQPKPVEKSPEPVTPPPEPITPKQSSPAPATPDQPIVRKVEEIKTEKKYVKPEDLVTKSVKKEKVRKGTSPPFDIKNLNSADMVKCNKAAINIQRRVRGYLSRLSTQRKLESVPHVINLKIDFGDGLPSNNDFMKSKPDVYVLANTFRMVASRAKGVSNLKEKIYTTGKTRTIAGNTSPVWEQELTLSLLGHKSLLCLNVMSRHNFGPDTIMGQCILSPEHMRALYSGHKVHLTLPVKQMEHSVYDTTGNLIKLAPASNPMGFISLTVNIPSIYHNMCGWFWDIKTGLLGNTYGDKIWVVLEDRKVRVYNNPFDQDVKEHIDTEHVIDIEEKTYDKMEISVEGLALHMIKPAQVKGGLDIPFEKMWAWGDDASKVKGLWRRALVNHHHAPALSQSIKQKIESGDHHIAVHTESGKNVTDKHIEQTQPIDDK